MLTSFALAFGVFSATPRVVNINGSISYTATNAAIEMVLSVINGFEDDNGDSALLPIGATRNVKLQNFTENDGVIATSNKFTIIEGSSTYFNTETNLWQIGVIYFNPSPNAVPSNQIPDESKKPKQVSITIVLSCVVTNYSSFALEIVAVPSEENQLSSISDASLGYDLTDANVETILPYDNGVASSGTSLIYIKLNDLSLLNNEILIDFAFNVSINKLD